MSKSLARSLIMMPPTKRPPIILRSGLLRACNPTQAAGSSRRSQDWLIFLGFRFVLRIVITYACPTATILLQRVILEIAVERHICWASEPSLAPPYIASITIGDTDAQSVGRIHYEYVFKLSSSVKIKLALAVGVHKKVAFITAFRPNRDIHGGILYRLSVPMNSSHDGRRNSYVMRNKETAVKKCQQEQQGRQLGNA